MSTLQKIEQEALLVWKNDGGILFLGFFFLKKVLISFFLVPKVITAALDELHESLHLADKKSDSDDGGKELAINNTTTSTSNMGSTTLLGEKKNPQNSSSSSSDQNNYSNENAQLVKTIETLKADLKKCENRIDSLVETIKDCFGKSFANALDKV